MPRSDTRARMVETAARLFQEQGYRATSWRRLVQEAGTPWGSAHHHFPGGKEQLGVAAIELGADAVAGLIEHSFATTATPADGVRAWFATSAALLERSDFRSGCPVATVALETSSDEPALAAACANALQRWSAIVAGALRRHGAGRTESRRLAAVVLAAFEGALVLGRVQRSARPLRDAARVLAEGPLDLRLDPASRQA